MQPYSPREHRAPAVNPLPAMGHDRSSSLILTTTILASGLGFLMGSSVTIALPVIQRALTVDIATVQWIANAYALALSGLILLSGSLGDILGTRRVYNSGILVFTIGSLASGLAPDASWLIAARALQGIGAALMIPGSLAIINDTFPPEARGRVIGLWAGVSGAIAALGPFIGGFLASLSWRLVFLAMVPLGAVTFIVSTISVPRLNDRRRTRVDWGGALLILVGLAGLSFGLIRLPEGAPVSATIALAVGVVAIIAFIPVERRHPTPLVPGRIFTRLVTGANIATVLLYFSFQAALFLLSFYLQQFVGLGATRAGLALLPATALIAVLSAASGSVTDRAGPRPQMIAGPLGVAAGLAVLYFGSLTGAGYLAGVLPGVVLVGLGMVTLIPAITKSALEVPRELSGTASGVNNAAARLSGLLAVTIIGSVLNGVFRSSLERRLPAALTEQARTTILARSGDLLNLTIPDGVDGDLRIAVESVLATSFRIAFQAGIAIALGAALAAGLTAAVLIRDPDPTSP